MLVQVVRPPYGDPRTLQVVHRPVYVSLAGCFPVRREKRVAQVGEPLRPLVRPQWEADYGEERLPREPVVLAFAPQLASAAIWRPETTYVFLRILGPRWLGEPELCSINESRHRQILPFRRHVLHEHIDPLHYAIDLPPWAGRQNGCCQ